jgi:hypothetical protein
MPNSLAIWRVLTQDVLGAQEFNGALGAPESMPADNYDLVEEAAAAILERIAAAVDWERLLEEAYWRHQDLHEDFEPEPRRSTTKDVCGECLREALLTDERYSPNWERHPSTPLTRQKVDWPSIVAANLKYREDARWHPYKDQETSK